jgi:membrane protease YdiL (CAAX protease family)
MRKYERIVQLMDWTRLKKPLSYMAVLLGGYILALILAGFLAPPVYEALAPKIGHSFDKYVDRLRWVGVLMLLPLWWNLCGAHSFRELGWKRRLDGFGLFLLGMVSVFALALTATVIFGEGLGAGEISMVPTRWNAFVLFAKGLAVAFGVSLLEELFFRGILQKIWIKGLGVRLGIWVGAFCFAWLHGRPDVTWFNSHFGFLDSFWLAGNYLWAFPANITIVELINLTLLGGVLGLLYDKSRSLWPSIGFHTGVVAMMFWMPSLAAWLGISMPGDPLIELPVTTVLLGLWAAAVWLWPNQEDESASV